MMKYEIGVLLDCEDQEQATFLAELLVDLFKNFGATVSVREASSSETIEA